MGSFYGAERFSIDHKGRVAVPARFRRALVPEARETFVAVPGLDGCLSLYPLNEWQRREEQFRNLALGDARARRFRRKFLVNAADLQVDGQGRVTLPGKLMEYAGLQKEALLVGAVDCIEIWDPERFEQLNEGEESLEDLAKDYLT